MTEDSDMRLNRRQLLGTTVAAAAGGFAPRAVIGAGAGLAAAAAAGPALAQGTPGNQEYVVHPGELDEYYVFVRAASPARSASSACPRCAN